MIKRIFKYALSPQADGSAVVRMPEHADILTVNDQNGTIMLWAEVDLSTADQDYKFWVVPTGERVPSCGYYIGTVFDGPFVWHVYEDVLEAL